METEFEAKFYPINKKLIRSKLKKIGARLVQPETLTRIIAFNSKFNPAINCHYVRVRDEGNCITMSVKINAKENEKLTDQKEIKVKVDDFDKTVEILERLSLHRSGNQEKLRETWQIDNVEIVIDTWPELETYIEIEAPSEELVKNTAEKLGLDWKERIITSVIEIFMKKYSQTADEVLKKFENLTFGNSSQNIK